MISNLAHCSLYHRIIVLTYDRPDSLYRLLKSLENSDYSFGRNNPNWNIILEIRVDGGGEQVGTKYFLTSARNIYQPRSWSEIFF